MTLINQTGSTGREVSTGVDAAVLDRPATANTSPSEIRLHWTPGTGPSVAIAMWKVVASVVTLLAALFYGIGRLLVDGFYSNLHTSASAAGVNTISIIEPAAIFGALLALSVTAILILSDIIQLWFSWIRKHLGVVSALVAAAIAIGLIVWIAIYFKAASHLGNLSVPFAAAAAVSFLRTPFDGIAERIQRLITGAVMKTSTAARRKRAGTQALTDGAGNPDGDAMAALHLALSKALEADAQLEPDTTTDATKASAQAGAATGAGTGTWAIARKTFLRKITGLMKAEEAREGDKAGTGPQGDAKAEKAVKTADAAMASVQAGVIKGADTGTETSARAVAETAAQPHKGTSSPWRRVTAVGFSSVIIIALCIGAHYVGVNEANRVKNGLPVSLNVAGLDISSISATRVRLEPVDTSPAIKSLSARGCLLELGPGAGDFLIYDAHDDETLSVPTSEVVIVDVTTSQQCAAH